MKKILILILSAVEINCAAHMWLVSVTPKLKEAQRSGSLDLRLNFIDPKRARALAKPLGKLTYLRELNLGYNKIGDAAAIAFAPHLGKLTSLKKLDIWGNKIGDTGAIALAPHLGKLTSLIWLKLSINQIGDAGAIALAPHLGKLRYLRHLLLDKNQIGAAGATALAPHLGKLTSLTRLSLSHNRIGAAGATALAQHLGKLRYLRHLLLDKNQIGDAGFRALAPHLAQYQSLSIGIEPPELRTAVLEARRGSIKPPPPPPPPDASFSPPSPKPVPQEIFPAIEANDFRKAIDLVKRFSSKQLSSLRGAHGENLLHRAIISSNPEFMREVFAKCGDILLSVKDSAGNNPFHVAVIVGDIVSCRIIEQLSDDITKILLREINTDGYSSFHLAVCKGKLSMLEYLLSVEMRVNPSSDVLIFRDGNKNTLLHVATAEFDATIISFLLKKEANPKLLNGKRRSCFDIAYPAGIPQSKMLIVDEIQKIYFFHAIATGNRREVKRFMDTHTRGKKK